MMKKSVVSLLLFLIISSLFAQLSNEEFDVILENEDIVILNENMKISYVGEKAYFMDVVIEKEIDYKILTEAGNDYLNPFVLPHDLDEVYKPHSSSIRNALRLYDDVEISQFEAWVIKDDGTKEKITLSKETQKNRIVLDKDKFGYLYNYSYFFQKLEPGQTIKVKYRYSFPFRNNWERLLSTRMFLVDKIPRKNFDLSWSHHYYLEVDTSYINGATPSMDTLNNYIHYSWCFENQPGSLDEQGSRPHADLPWFTFTPKPYELLYEHYNSFQEDFIPFWYFLSFSREVKIRSAVEDYVIGAKDKDNLKLERIAKKFMDMAPDDTIGITRLRYLQRYIIDSTVYDDDFKMFNQDEDYKRDHAGLELYGGLVKEHNKEFIYASIIPKFGNIFFTAYTIDSRYGYISTDYFAPMFDNEIIFAAVLNNNSLAYIIPKSDNRGLYCEELPFYYENTPAMLLYTYDFAGYKRNFEDVFRKVNTPGSNANDNFRKTNCIARVNLTEGKIGFQTKITLSGQYSTLTRFVYKEETADNSINPLYLKKVWEIGGSHKVGNVKVGQTDYYFPFKTYVDASYTVDGKIQENGANIKIDLSGWVKHIIYNNFKKDNRFTDFYSDFSGADTYAYMLEFDQAVEFSEIPNSTDIDNDFGTYKFNIKQLAGNKILISSYFLVKSNMITKENIGLVATIFNEIEENNSIELRLIKVNE